MGDLTVVARGESVGGFEASLMMFGVFTLDFVDVLYGFLTGVELGFAYGFLTGEERISSGSLRWNDWCFLGCVGVVCADGGSGARGGVGTVGAGGDRAGDAVEGGEGW